MVKKFWSQLLGHPDGSELAKGRTATPTRYHRTHGGVADRRRRLVASAPVPPPNHQIKPNPAPAAAPIWTLGDPNFQFPGLPGRGIRIQAAGAGRQPLLGRDLRADGGERRPRPGRCAALPHLRRRRRHGRVRRGRHHIPQARRSVRQLPQLDDDDEDGHRARAQGEVRRRRHGHPPGVRRGPAAAGCNDARGGEQTPGHTAAGDRQLRRERGRAGRRRRGLPGEVRRAGVHWERHQGGHQGEILGHHECCVYAVEHCSV